MIVLNVGDKAPDFSVIDDQNIIRNNFDYLGQKLIIFFYPKASTPGCTAEACNLNDNLDYFVQNNYAILGVSADSIKAQLKFKQKYNFKYPLLADENRTMLNDFGVWGSKKFMGVTYDGIHRTTFIIDEKGIITHIITNVKTKNHTEQIQNLL